MKILFLSILFFFCIKSYSQDTSLVVNKKFRQSTLPKSFRAYTTIDYNSGELHLTLVDNKSIDRYIIDSNWKIVNQFSSPRGVYSILPYGRFNDMQITGTQKIDFCIYSKGDKKFEINRVDFINQTEVKVSEFEVNRKESVISSFTTSNIFCLITAEKNGDILNVITNARNGGISFDTISVELSITTKDLSAAKLMSAAVLIGPGEQSIEKLAAANKIYYSGNTLYISNEHHDATYITEVNLITGDMKRKIFQQQFIGSMPESSKRKFNSFLYNNILVNGNLYNAALSVSFYDYNNEHLIKNYTVAKNDTIGFKNGPIIFKKDKELATTKEFIKKALKGELAFALANAGKNQIELLIESYYEPKGGGGGGGGFFPGSPGGSISTPGGMVSLPSTPGYFAGADFGISSTQNNPHFKCLFEPGTFEHIGDGNETKSLAELIENELDEKNNRTVISIFTKDNYLYLGFYEAKNETYIIKNMGKLIEDR